MERLIQRFGLIPHPEGGWYRETYRASATLPGTGRSVCTAILYLLAAGQRSRLHRIDADELWHFHDGDPLQVIELASGAPARVSVLGRAAPAHRPRRNLVRRDARARVALDAVRLHCGAGIRVLEVRAR